MCDPIDTGITTDKGRLMVWMGRTAKGELTLFEGEQNQVTADISVASTATWTGEFLPGDASLSSSGHRGVTVGIAVADVGRATVEAAGRTWDMTIGHCSGVPGVALLWVKVDLPDRAPNTIGEHTLYDRSGNVIKKNG
ncbi:hypothetical protein [Longispora albida]|uniref:hypothetical protein n=1 Tax=Longispora albida TaxID=203523 RepID=UPI00036C2BC0|nr:hypothetical protein [Longispora albida]